MHEHFLLLLQARAGIQEVHFLPFNPVDKRTAITYIDSVDGKWYRSSKGAPEQILELAHNKTEIAARVHSIIDKFAERGLRSLAVARQASTDKSQLMRSLFLSRLQIMEYCPNGMLW